MSKESTLKEKVSGIILTFSKKAEEISHEIIDKGHATGQAIKSELKELYDAGLEELDNLTKEESVELLDGAIVVSPVDIQIPLTPSSMKIIKKDQAFVFKSEYIPYIKTPLTEASPSQAYKLGRDMQVIELWQMLPNMGDTGITGINDAGRRIMDKIKDRVKSL